MVRTKRMPTQDDCRRAILRLWQQSAFWAEKPSYENKQMFYLWLEKNRSDLLAFRVRRDVDKWQVVHGWLNRG
jgi:hypothetical protein